MTVEQLKLENETLTARLNKAKEVFRQQAADIKAKDEAYLKLRDEYNDVVRERDTHIEANAKFNTQLLAAEATIAELKASDNSNAEALQEELNATKKSLHIANTQLEGYDTKCTRYDEVIKSLNETIQNLQMKNDELEGLATSRLVDSKKNDEELEKLNATIEEMNANKTALEEKYNLLEAQFNDLEREYTNSEEQRKSYREVADKINNEVTRLQGVIESKDAAYKNLESTYNDFAAEHVRDVNALKYTIDQLKTELEKKDTDLKGVEKLLLDKAETIKSLEDKLTAESGKVEEVKTKTEVAVTTIKKKLQALNDGLGDEFNIFG